MSLGSTNNGGTANDPLPPPASTASLQSLHSLASMSSAGNFSSNASANPPGTANGSFSFPRPMNRMVTRQTSHQVVQNTAERSETADRVRLQVDLPGVFPQDVNLSLFKNMLFIKAVRRKYNADNVCVKKYVIQKRYPFDVASLEVYNKENSNNTSSSNNSEGSENNNSSNSNNINITATMNRGVLTISAPRKTPEFKNIDEAAPTDKDATKSSDDNKDEQQPEEEDEEEMEMPLIITVTKAEDPNNVLSTLASVAASAEAIDTENITITTENNNTETTASASVADNSSGSS